MSSRREYLACVRALGWEIFLRGVVRKTARTRCRSMTGEGVSHGAKFAESSWIHTPGHRSCGGRRGDESDHAGTDGAVRGDARGAKGHGTLCVDWHGSAG